MLTTLAWKICKMKKKSFLGIERKYTETHLSTQVFFCKLVINDSWFSSKNEAVSHKACFSCISLTPAIDDVLIVDDFLKLTMHAVN